MSIPEEFQTELDGHVVDARRLDEFFHGKDGTRLSDEEWDAAKAATVAPDVTIADEPPAGDVIA